ncbi:hypothetical protein EUX98_g4911 [Antrodiella citrinella]|uniref:Uncharacterized protein n=1 Tax=Antrodiella citrinella TaxID=2447956 RepID=A0A4S4MUM9_9APHY|nr:hypothetical protein EUX98_g4911 [Antrodiella citrinella]
MLSDRSDSIRGYFDNDDTNQLQNGTFESWEQIEAAFDRIRTPISSYADQRVLNIWMLDTLAGRMRTERVETIWRGLPLQGVHMLYLEGVPVDIPEGCPQLQRTLRTFMNYICPMSPVRHLMVRGWDPSWLEELVAARRSVYPDVDWTVLLPFFDLESSLEEK